MITASKQLWLWLTAHGGLGRCRYLTSSSYCHKCFLFLCRSVRVQTLLKLTVVVKSSHLSVFLDSPPSYLRRKEETWGEKESRLLTRWDKWRWIQLNVPQYPSIVDVSLSDVERTAAYEELRKQWRAESLIAHLTVFKWQTRLMNTKETRTVLLLPRFEYFIWVSSLFYTKDAPSLTAPLTPPLSTRLQSKHYLY